MSNYDEWKTTPPEPTGTPCRHCTRMDTEHAEPGWGYCSMHTWVRVDEDDECCSFHWDGEWDE